MQKYGNLSPPPSPSPVKGEEIFDFLRDHLNVSPIIFLTQFMIDDLVKSLKSVTPAEAGVQKSLNLLDSRFRGNDKKGEIETFYETVMIDS